MHAQNNNAVNIEVIFLNSKRFCKLKKANFDTLINKSTPVSTRLYSYQQVYTSINTSIPVSTRLYSYKHVYTSINTSLSIEETRLAPDQPSSWPCTPPSTAWVCPAGSRAASSCTARPSSCYRRPSTAAAAGPRTCWSSGGAPPSPSDRCRPLLPAASPSAPCQRPLPPEPRLSTCVRPWPSWTPSEASQHPPCLPSTP